MKAINKNLQYYKFCMYGFLKNLRFFDAFFILFLIDKGLSYTQIGVMYAVREITINIFEIPSGLFADTYGRKNSLAGSFFAYILSFCVFYFSANFWLFLIAFVFYGIGDAFRTGTHKGMIMDYLKQQNIPEQNINYYGHTRSWSQMGSALSSLIAGVIVFFSGAYASVFLYSVIPYLLNLALILSYPGDLNRSVSVSDHKRKSGLGNTVSSFFRVIKKRNVLRLINTSALHTAYLRAVKDYIQPLLVNIALILPVMASLETEKKNAVVIAFVYFIIFLLTSRASIHSAKFASGGKEITAYLSLMAGFVSGGLCGIFFHLEWWFPALIAFSGIYLIENVRKPILTGYISDNVPNSILVSVISAQSLLRTIMTSLIALVFGVIADRNGIGISFMVVSGFLVISSAFIHFFTASK